MSNAQPTNEYGSKVHDEIGWDGKKYIRYQE